MSGRICKYSCGTELKEFDTVENKYREIDGQLHTRERCESLKQNKAVYNWTNDKPKQETQDLSLEIVLKKLQSIGITLDLAVLRNITNGDKK